MIDTIIFDLGGVILTHESGLIENMLSDLFSLHPKEAADVWKSEKVELLNGRMTLEQFFLRLQKKYNSKKSLNVLLGEERDYYRKQAHIDTELLTFIEQLNKKYKVYLFTDTIKSHDEYNKSRGIYEKFEKVIRSYKEKIAKAEGEAAFVKMLEFIGADPSRCIFIDDTQRYINIAEKIGMRAILYKNKEQLERELELQGVSIN